GAREQEVSIQWVGLDRWQAKLAKAAVEIPVAARTVMGTSAEAVLQEAQRRVEANLKEPGIDTGEVAASGSVRETATGAEVSFSHRAAAYIHEGIRGNEAHRKFLEGPANESLPEVTAAEKAVLEAGIR